MTASISLTSTRLLSPVETPGETEEVHERGHQAHSPSDPARDVARTEGAAGPAADEPPRERAGQEEESRSGALGDRGGTGPAGRLGQYTLGRQRWRTSSTRSGAIPMTRVPAAQITAAAVSAYEPFKREGSPSVKNIAAAIRK